VRTLAQLKPNGRRDTGGSQPADRDLLRQRLVELDAGELRHVLAQAHLGSSRIDQARLRRDGEPLNDEINDRPSPTGQSGQRLESVPHNGAMPVASNSRLGTRNMLSASWECSASQPTTVRGSGAATNTSGPLVATH
jgi:hypothetical protein